MVQTSDRAFIESELTIDVRDRAARRFDDHELKLWYIARLKRSRVIG